MQARKIMIECENGHRKALWISQDDPRLLGPEGPRGEFATGEHVSCESYESYAYTHGGCCYRAAVDALHDVGLTPEPTPCET